MKIKIYSENLSYLIREQIYRSMKNTNSIEEEIYIVSFLEKRNLLSQYKKAKQKILDGNFRELKLRKPKENAVWYFRINKQFRAYGHFEWNTLVIYKIDNHQNG